VLAKLSLRLSSAIAPIGGRTRGSAAELFDAERGRQRGAHILRISF
jgi:hypothetical protein